MALLSAAGGVAGVTCLEHLEVPAAALLQGPNGPETGAVV